MYSSAKLFCAYERVILVFIFWVVMHFLTWVHALFYSLHEIRIFSTHDDIIKWKPFPHYWFFMRGIHRSQENDDSHTSTLFLAHPDHILQMTSQSIADDITVTRLENDI